MNDDARNHEREEDLEDFGSVFLKGVGNHQTNYMVQEM
jgi:hypothetical protein